MLAAKSYIPGTPSPDPAVTGGSEEVVDPIADVTLIPHASFAARFCMHRGIKLEEFEGALFQRALYPGARWLRPLLEKLPDFFSADRMFIAMVGRAKTMRDVESAMVDFADNRGRFRFLRKRLKLRVSASTVWMLTNRLLKEAPPPAPMLLNSRPPFSSQVEAWRAGAVAVAVSNTAAARSDRAMKESEISRLRGEVERLTAQCELLKRAVGLFSETRTPPPSYT